MSNKIHLVLLLLFIWLIIMPCQGILAAGSEEFWTPGIKALAQAMIRQFGVLEARVAAVDGNKIYINAGKSKYINVGTVFEVIAEDQPIIDPVSRGRLGNLELHVADIKIETVRDNLSIGSIINQGKGLVKPAVGQRAILKKSKVKVGMMPVEYLNSKDQTTPRIIQELLITELINSGRVMVAQSDKTAKIMNELSRDQTPGSAQFTKVAGRILGVDYIIYGFMTDLPGFFEIQCRAHDTTNGIGIAAASIKINAATMP